MTISKMISEFEEVLKEEYRRKVALIGDPIKEMVEVNQKLRNQSQLIALLSDECKNKTDWREFQTQNEFLNALKSLVWNSIILQNEALKLSLVQPDESKQSKQTQT